MREEYDFRPDGVVAGGVKEVTGGPKSTPTRGGAGRWPPEPEVARIAAFGMELVEWGSASGKADGYKP